jgi:hypothetical protein
MQVTNFANMMTIKFVLSPRSQMRQTQQLDEPNWSPVKTLRPEIATSLTLDLTDRSDGSDPKFHKLGAWALHLPLTSAFVSSLCSLCSSLIRHTVHPTTSVGSIH